MSPIEIAFVAGSSLGGMLVYLLVWWAFAKMKGRRSRRVRASVAVATAPPKAVGVRPTPGAGKDPVVPVGEIDVGDFDLIEESEASEVLEESFDAMPKSARVTDFASGTDELQNELGLEQVGSAAAPDPVTDTETRGGGTSLAALTSEIEAQRAVLQELGDQMAAFAHRLGEIEVTGLGTDLQARIEASVQAALGQVAETQADVAAAVAAHVAPLNERLGTFETEQAMLMRSTNLASMRALATIQVEMDALAERIASLSALRPDLPTRAGGDAAEPHVSKPRAVASGQGKI